MPIIGSFQRTADGFTGRLRTLTLDIELTLVPLDPTDADDAPDYRVHRGSEDDGPQVGAGWKRTGARVGDYVAVSLDDPALAQPLWANLFPTDAERVTFVLAWNRPARREDGR